jgi:hypothetical protein
MSSSGDDTYSVSVSSVSSVEVKKESKKEEGKSKSKGKGKGKEKKEESSSSSSPRKKASPKTVRVIKEDVATAVMSSVDKCLGILKSCKETDAKDEELARICGYLMRQLNAARVKALPKRNSKKRSTRVEIERKKKVVVV